MTLVRRLWYGITWSERSLINRGFYRVIAHDRWIFLSSVDWSNKWSFESVGYRECLWSTQFCSGYCVVVNKVDVTVSVSAYSDAIVTGKWSLWFLRRDRCPISELFIRSRRNYIQRLLLGIKNPPLHAFMKYWIRYIERR